jgi:hypothetical protein
MRVALCFWGLCRSTHIVLNSIQRNIFSTLTDLGIEYDVYLHTFILTGSYTNERANEHYISLRNTNFNLLHPFVVKVENQDDVDIQLQLPTYRTQGNPWKDPDHPTSWTTFDNHIRSLYSLREVYLSLESSGRTYDAIVFLRPDVRYLESLYQEMFCSLTPKDILLPNFHMIDGVNDRFAICHPETAWVYGKRFEYALEYSKRFPLHSETFLKWVIEKNALHVSHIPFVFQRVRATGETAPADTELITHIARHRILTVQQKS